MHVVEDIKLEIQAFQQWQITFVRKEGNQVAHLLAKYVVKHVKNISWRETPPECIRDALYVTGAICSSLLII